MSEELAESDKPNQIKFIKLPTQQLTNCGIFLIFSTILSSMLLRGTLATALHNLILAYCFGCAWSSNWSPTFNSGAT